MKRCMNCDRLMDQVHTCSNCGEQIPFECDRDSLRAEVEQLRQALHDARIENSGQAAELEKLKEQYRRAHSDCRHYKDIAEHRRKEFCELAARPAPGRLEIAAMIKAGWFANPQAFCGADKEGWWWLEQADTLIAASKEVQG